MWIMLCIHMRQGIIWNQLYTCVSDYSLDGLRQGQREFFVPYSCDVQADHF